MRLKIVVITLQIKGGITNFVLQTREDNCAFRPSSLSQIFFSKSRSQHFYLQCCRSYSIAYDSFHKLENGEKVVET